MDKNLRIAAYGLALILILCGAAKADQLPPRKVISSLTPAAATAIDYNFSLVWNAINGAKIAADNAPTLFSKVYGGTSLGSLKCQGCGIIITSSGTSTATAGKLKIEHTTPELVISSGASANRARITLEGTLAAGNWTIDKNTSDHLAVTGASASTNVILNNPLTFATNGITYKTLAVPMGLPAAAGANEITANSTWKKIINIPADAQRGGNWKVRLVAMCAAADATIATSFYHQYFIHGDASGAITGPANFDNLNCAGTEYKVTAWVTIAGPAAGSGKAMQVIFVNGDAATALNQATLEIQYPATQNGNTVDN